MRTNLGDDVASGTPVRGTQVSGVAFAFDGTLPAGERVVVDSVRVASEPLDEARVYRVAVKAYLADGKDGFDCLLGVRLPAPDPRCLGRSLPPSLHSLPFLLPSRARNGVKTAMGLGLVR